MHSQGRDITLHIKPVFGKELLILEKKNYTTENGDTVSINRLRFYITALQLQFDNGTSFTEKNTYHLLDAEELQTLKITLKNIPEGKITSLKFNVGVDSTANVSGALDGDLDPAKGMYWAWNSGYINAKLEGKSKNCRNAHNEFEFHIGGYLPPHKTVREVNLKVNAPTNPSLVVLSDVAYWFKNIKLQKINSIVIPGTEATKMADDYSKMFRIEE